MHTADFFAATADFHCLDFLLCGLG